MENGLICGHAYSVTEVREVNISDKNKGTNEKAQLIRVRNPWGNEAEWKGDWGDKYLQ